MENDRRLGREDWMRAARLALLHTGPDSVRVEKLARTLNVTKGSFYWHFKDRNEILEALLREWEEETATLTRDALIRGKACATCSKSSRPLWCSARGEKPLRMRPCSPGPRCPQTWRAG